MEGVLSNDPYGNTNERTMKKVFQVIVALVVFSSVLSACSSSHSCPAYGKVHKVPAEAKV